MVKRTITSLVLLAVGMPALLFGGVPFFIFMGFFIVMAAYEYTVLFRAMHTEPSTWITVGGVFLILLARDFFPEFASAVFCPAAIGARISRNHLRAGTREGCIRFCCHCWWPGLPWLGGSLSVWNCATCQTAVGGFFWSCPLSGWRIQVRIASAGHMDAISWRRV